MFELKTSTECELTTFVGRTQKEGRDDIPAVTFRLKLNGVSNEMLDLLSPTIRHTAYAPVEGQEQLPGVEVTTPVLRSKDLKHWKPETRLEGWKVSIAHGIGDDSSLMMDKCKLDDFVCDFYEGGHIDMDFRVSTADIDEIGAGKLWAKQKRRVMVLVIAPELPPKEEKPIDGTGQQFKRDHPLFDDQPTTGDGDSNAGDQDATGAFLQAHGRSEDEGGPLSSDDVGGGSGDPEDDDRQDQATGSAGPADDDTAEFAAGAEKAVLGRRSRVTS